MKIKFNKKFLKNFLLGLSLCLSCLSLCWMLQPYNRAMLLWQKGHKEKAIAIWNDQIKRKQDLDSYQKLIEVLINSGDYEKAEELAKNALPLYPSCTNLMFYLAMTNFYKGNLTDSLKYTEDVLSINEYFPEVYLLRGLIFEKMNNLEQAKKEFIKEINNNPSNRLAWAKLKEQKYANI
ncbi:MAG: hypothetical protein NC906_03600 [Candidatus Omnitrophica bacterium]|nr:hypothetical protein [Candidatus Omnitrophota bacterium]MCM8817407.1 hypothetical protein [Candidatus Omnitrophota bacterium]